MRFIRHSAFLLIMIVTLVPSVSLRACPLCKDAIASPGDGEEEINNAPQAYNTSIYLMVGVPYLLLGSVGFCIYRGCQKNARFLEQESAVAS